MQYLNNLINAFFKNNYHTSIIHTLLKHFKIYSSNSKSHKTLGGGEKGLITLTC